MLELQPGDIFLTKGNSFISRVIRILTRDKGESRTEANHVGIVTESGTISTATIVEALTKVKRRKMEVYRKSKSTAIAIFRPINLSQEELDTIVFKANSYVGADYGYGKLITHFIDWLLGGVYFARRFTNSDNYPICSWLVAYAYMTVDKDFGVEPGAASPDDIWDFCITNTDKYQMVHSMIPLFEFDPVVNQEE